MNSRFRARPPKHAAVLREVRALLRLGGLLLAIQHDAEAFSARVLGERSPIIDIEHTYLYTPGTLSRLCGKTGFTPLSTGASWNRYSLDYLAHLLPLGASLRRGVTRTLSAVKIGELAMWAPLGNFFLIARKEDGSGI